MRKLLSTVVLVTGICTGAFAQYGAPRGERILNASISGRGGDGKCTVEVNVDDVAIVEIVADRGRLITLSGQPAEWRRFECNQRMPAYPNEFRFSGVDGRGRQTLLKDPATNRGIAVIRIEDPKGGREGYTFDITWRGGADRPGYSNGDRGRDRNEARDRNDDRDRNQDRDRNALLMRCESTNGYRQVCEVDTRGGVRLVRQFGGAACREGSSWGFDRRGIWVDRGCRAEFEVKR